MSSGNYHRTFFIQSAHFNGEDVYKRLKQSQDAEAYKFACINSHGHNFKIEVDVAWEGDLFRNNPHDFYFFADEELDQMLATWRDTNLSLHEDFLSKDYRATTERIAQVFVGKLLKLAHFRVGELEPSGNGRTQITVIVHENDFIHGSYSDGFTWQ